MKNWIQEAVVKNAELTLSLRRYFHQNPELSFQEYDTSKLIKKALSDWDIPFTEGHVDTGILVTLTSGDSSKTIALRSDIDALPIQELVDFPYASKNEGVMHACGHDAHMATLLTSLKILNENKDKWTGTIYGFFQPGEEKLPGGAKLFLDEGGFPTEPDCIIGNHVYPDLEAGKVGVCSGSYMASCDEVFITVRGEGGHAALPHKLIDPIVVAAQLITQAQTIVSRKISPYVPAVFSFGAIHGGKATNIIPYEVELMGTFRCLDENEREIGLSSFQDLCIGLEKQTGAQIDVEIKRGYPMISNNEDLAKTVIKVGEKIFGKDKVVTLGKRMTSDDFAYFSQKYPGVYYRFGVAKKGEAGVKRLHNGLFEIDEEALKVSVSMMLGMSVEVLAD